MVLDELLERAGPTGLLLHTTEKSGRFTGVNSNHSTIKGTTGCTGDTGRSYLNDVGVVDEFFTVSSLRFVPAIEFVRMDNSGQ